MVSPASFEPPSSPAPGRLRSTVKKSALGVYKLLLRPFARPVMWRIRTFLLQPVHESLDRSYEALHHEQAQLARSLESHARSDDIQALRQEQAQLARSLENHARSDEIQALRQEHTQLAKENHARSDDIQTLRQEQAQLAMSLQNHARSDDIQALRQEQAQLVRSLEALALTIASNPPRER